MSSLQIFKILYMSSQKLTIIPLVQKNSCAHTRQWFNWWNGWYQ